MMSTELLFIRCWAIICGILTDNGSMAQDKIIKIEDKEGNPSRHYIEGGTATALCINVFTPNVTVNGIKAIGIQVGGPNEGGRSNISIPLNDKTILGNYASYDGRKRYELHRIGYILCDPGQMVPAKVCPEGQFCVINGTKTSCKAQLDCEGVTGPEECINGTNAKRTNFSCSVYNNAENNTKGYYLGPSHHSKWCGADLIVVHKGEVVKFLSTVPISSSLELESGELNVTAAHLVKFPDFHLHCNMKMPKGISHTINFNESDFSAALKAGLPAKMNVACSNTNGRGSSFGYTKFYILFYEKNRTRFSIVQGNTKVNITNSTKNEIVLYPKIPFNCTVQTDKGLFVKAFISDGNSTEAPHIGQSSIHMGSSDSSSTTEYTCIAKVYFYEQLGDVGFKLLYEEKRVVTIKFSAASTASHTTTLSTWSSGL